MEEHLREESSLVSLTMSLYKRRSYFLLKPMRYFARTLDKIPSRIKTTTKAIVLIPAVLIAGYVAYKTFTTPLNNLENLNVVHAPDSYGTNIR